VAVQGSGTLPPFSDEQELRQVLSCVRLRSANTPEAVPGVNNAHVDLALALLRVLRTGISDVALCWPASPEGVIALHGLGALGLASLARNRDLEHLRVAYFPWTSRAGDSAKRVLVDRDWLVALHRAGLTRALRDQASAVGTLAIKLHLAMVRLQDLDGIVHYKGKSRGTTAFLHPTLAETCAYSLVQDSTEDRVLLHRIRKYTSIKKLNFDGADHPNRSPFALFGIRPGAASIPVLTDAQGVVDIFVINAMERRCEALGDDWPRQISRVLAASRERWKRPLPVFAVTDSPWIQHVLARKIVPEHLGANEATKIATTTVLLEPSHIYEKRPPFEASGAERIRFYAPSGAPATIEATYRELIRDAGDMAENDVLNLLIESRQAFRRCVNLPASLGEWQHYLYAASGMTVEEATEIFQSFDARRPLRKALTEHPECLSIQFHQDAMRALLEELNAFVERHASAPTAAARVFSELLTDKLHSNAHCVVVLGDDRIREFVEHLVASLAPANNAALGPARRLSLMSLAQFREIAEGRTRPPEGLSSAIVLGLGRRRLMQLLGARWLPDEVAIVSDVGAVSAIAVDSERLEKRPGLRPLSERLGRVFLAAAECVEGCTEGLPALAWEQPPLPDADAALGGGVVDLRGLAPHQAGSDVRFLMESGQRILARRRSTVIRFDSDAPVDVFQEDFAENIRPGDQIAVLGRSFFESVKEKLGSGAAVAREVRLYHNFVAQTVAAMHGNSHSEKALLIMKAMAEKGRNVSFGQVADWIHADRYLKEDDATVRPHAPMHYEDYVAFMQVLKAPDLLIPRLWQLGVMMTRSLRLSTASQLYDMCIAILTRTNDMVAQYPERAEELFEVRARAEATIGVVSQVFGSIRVNSSVGAEA
jgi:hypothetical protein